MTLLALLPAFLPPACAGVTVLSEGFEGAFPGQWSAGTSIPGGTATTWQAVDSSFGGVGTHSGQGKCFCAGSQPTNVCATVDFTGATISADGDVEAGCSGSYAPSEFTYRSDGPAWAMSGEGSPALTFQFTPAVSGQYTLTLTHLTSASSGCQGGGYSPVTIAANGMALASCYDPAAAHNGSHEFVTDSWSFSGTAEEEVTITWTLCSDACTEYWIQGLSLAGPIPEYQNGMSAFMQQAINLTGCTNATLSFWQVMPSVQPTDDYGRVLIDGTEIWRVSSAVGTWSNVQISLAGYTGAWHVLRFEFDSDGSAWGRGWYLDDILVTNTASSLGETNAPIIFSASDFPSQIGEYYLAYSSTNAVPGSVTNWLAQSGAAQVWDFSQPEQAGEFIQRMDIVAPSDDAESGGSFPGATYAERMTTESTGDQSWSFYSLTTNQGRFYYGFDHPIDAPIDAVIVFYPPALQFPVPVQFGQAWEWDTDFTTEYQDVIESVQLTTFDTVDGYGTFVVPGGLKPPALRVKELQREAISISGSNALTVTATNYYWLVRGVGLAGQLSCPATNVPAGIQSLRVFQASDFEDLLTPVNHLQIGLQNSYPVLTWSPAAGGSGYRVESTADLAEPAWQLVDLPSRSPWTNASPASGPQEFFRVYTRP